MKLKLPNPCYEDWNRMTPQDQGRHCAACDRVILDFSGMTDAELVSWLRAHPGKICGRFRKDQMNRELRAPWQVPGWGRVAAALVAMGLMTQTLPAQTPQNAQVQAPNFPAGKLKPLRIHVMDGESGTPLERAWVEVAGKVWEALPDAAAMVQAEVPEGKEAVAVHVGALGYAPQRIVVDSRGILQDVEVKLVKAASAPLKTIRGTVLSQEDSTPVPFARVAFFTSSEVPIATVMTDENGDFSWTGQDAIAVMAIQVSMLEYETLDMPLNPSQKKNEMLETVLYLSEVKLVASWIVVENSPSERIRGTFYRLFHRRGY